MTANCTSTLHNKPVIEGAGGSQVKLFAVAVKTGYNRSEVFQATYKITGGSSDPGDPADPGTEGNMWANRYPLEDALKLFGAVSGYGAQAQIALPSLGSGTNYYVDDTNGNNTYPGTSPSLPWKELQYALNTVNAGDTIHIAEGNYLGPANRGFLIMTKPVNLIGGYAHDFGSRDILVNRTMIQPQMHSNVNNNLLSLGDPTGAGAYLPAGNVVIDGIIFDRGFFNDYNSTKGKPDGVDTGSLSKDLSFSSVLIGAVTGCRANVTIQNCTFLNSSNYGITISPYASTSDPRTVIIKNNVFVANCYAAVDISNGSSQAANLYETNVDFADNTVLFNWQRTDETAVVRDNLGYGYRFRTGVNGDVHGCIIGFSIQAGLDRSWQGVTAENKRQTRFYNNAFVLNRFADFMGVQSPNNVYYFSNQFADFETLWSDIKKYDGNIELTGDRLAGKLNVPYVRGWIDRSFGNKSNPAPDAALSAKVNAFKAAFGL